MLDTVVLPAHAQMSPPAGPMTQTLSLLPGGPGPSGECGTGGEFTNNLVGVQLTPGGVDGTQVTLNIAWANPGAGRANSTLMATVSGDQAIFDNTAGASVNVDVCNDNFDTGVAPDNVTLTFTHPNGAGPLVAGPFAFNDLV